MLGIFLDTETNGLNSLKHRVIDIAIKVLDLQNGNIVAEYQSLVRQPKEIWENSDPVSLSVNGYNYETISHGKVESLVSSEIVEFFESHNLKRKKAVFICQNPSFDRPFFSQLVIPEIQEKLSWPYHWLDLASMHWAVCMKKGKPYPWEIGLSKDAIARFLSLPEEAKPHRAKNGVEHLILCYEKIIGFPSS